MKYLKLYEDIDWQEDWDEEDECKVGDTIILNIPQYYNKNKWENLDTDVKGEVIGIIKGILLSPVSPIHRMPLDYDDYIVKIKHHWPWFKLKDYTII